MPLVLLVNSGATVTMRDLEVVGAAVGSSTLAADTAYMSQTATSSSLFSVMSALISSAILSNTSRLAGGSYL